MIDEKTEVLQTVHCFYLVGSALGLKWEEYFSWRVHFLPPFPEIHYLHFVWFSVVAALEPELAKSQASS